MLPSVKCLRIGGHKAQHNSHVMYSLLFQANELDADDTDDEDLWAAVKQVEARMRQAPPPIPVPHRWSALALEEACCI